MTQINKKTWPDQFERLIKEELNTEIRLADFDLSEGDVLILEEYDPSSKSYTGRTLKKKVKALAKVDVAKYHSLEEIKKHGLYKIELE